MSYSFMSNIMKRRSINSDITPTHPNPSKPTQPPLPLDSLRPSIIFWRQVEFNTLTVSNCMFNRFTPKSHFE